MEISILVGVIAGTLGVSGFAYQTWKNPFGMSYPMIFLVGTGITLWMTYGFAIGNLIISLPNAIMLGLLAATTIRKIDQDEEFLK